MSAIVTVTIVCDVCQHTLPTTRQRPSGARGDAERRGWRVSHKGDGYRSAGRSDDPGRRDECPECRADKKPVDMGLFGEARP